VQPRFASVSKTEQLPGSLDMTTASSASSSSTATVTVTERAARRVAEIVATEPATKLLRVSVEGGGCSGFQYKFELVAAPDSDDLVIERAGAKVVIDQISVGYLGGSEIDFVDDLMGQSFKIRNPNATASCGCGTSFAL
jgi:iron-sulfur cluster assembly accessory protein